jgi:hypothetical protein
MKKLNIYIAIVLALLVLHSNAQTNLRLKTSQFPADMKNAPTWKKANQLGKSTAADWYFPQDFILDPLQTFVTFLVNDSAKYYSSTTGEVSYNASWAATAQILDPKDDAIELSSNTTATKLSKYTNYTVDSVGLTYLYVRKIDTVDLGAGFVPVVDTLFVTYYKGSQVSTTGSFDDHTKFGMVGWDFNKQFPANYAYTDTVLLGDKSLSTTVGPDGWQQKGLTLPVPPMANMTINSTGSLINNLCAFSIRFKHGVKFDSTFVLDDRRDVPNPSNKYINYFGYQFGQISGATNPANDNFYNSSLMVPARFAFASINGWQGWYPGYAFDKYQYPSMGLFLSALNVGIDEVKENAFTMSNVFPNPAKASEGAALIFKLKASSKVTVEIFNLMGQKVKTVTNKNYDLGESNIELNLEGMHPGVYFVNMTANGSTTTKKLTITE